MKPNEQFKSKRQWEAKIQWCKCEIILNLGMTNCINCNTSESLLEIWAVRGNKCLLSRTGPCKWCTEDGTGWGTVLRDVCVLVREWVERPLAYRHATQNSPKFHLSPEVVVRQGQPTGTRLHHFPSKPVFTFSRCCLPC